MKLDMAAIADRAVREALHRHRAALADLIDELANESGVIVHGVRYVNAVRLLAALVPPEPTP